MNSDKSRRRSQRGNAMIYILVGLGLLAALTAVMSKQNDDGGDDLSDDQAALQATQMISYAAAAQGVVEQMLQSGSTVANLNFNLPSTAGFDTAPNGNKFYHPEGGGFNYKAPQIPPFVTSSASTPEGWYITKRNVTWTPTTSNDIVMAAYNISPSVCSAINKKITGTAAPVALASSSTRNYLTDYSLVNFTNVVCPACDGYASLCVVNASGTNGAPTFYTILSGK